MQRDAEAVLGESVIQYEPVSSRDTRRESCDQHGGPGCDVECPAEVRQSPPGRQALLSTQLRLDNESQCLRQGVAHSTQLCSPREVLQLAGVAAEPEGILNARHIAGDRYRAQALHLPHYTGSTLV
eukprot:1292744-Pyramimonas_sp.AAC.1